MQVVWLSRHDGSRRNNLTLIRLLLATAVLFGHAFVLTGDGLDPLSKLFFGHTWIGAVAVDGFFMLSGFLVAGSFVRQGPLAFAVARALRIYPATIVFTLLAVFLLGPLFTTLPLHAYFADPVTWAYLKAATLTQTEWTLPGVFKDRAFAGIINGSLWTLTIEARCYILVLAAGLLGAFRSRLAANLILLALLVLGFTFPGAIPLIGLGQPNWLRPCASFVVGVFVFVNRDRVPLHGGLALATLALLAGALPTPLFDLILPPALAYLLFYAAYQLPHVDLDRFGDISFGVYIYAWPVQQFFRWDGQSGYVNAALAAPVVLVLAILSWFLVEKPALALRAPLLAWLRSLRAQPPRAQPPQQRATSRDPTR